MANPNIVDVTSIYGKTVQIAAQKAATATNGTQLVSNAASSGKVYKINTILAANVDTNNNAQITVTIWNEATATSAANYDICKTVTVPADAMVVVLDKNTAIYLEEDHSIYCTASEDGDIEVTCSYEEIS
tara:strand:- start:626 stop:1015 length:390 start_codon:yes stop_codon:yes gene_type:complete